MKWDTHGLSDLGWRCALIISSSSSERDDENGVDGEGIGGYEEKDEWDSGDDLGGADAKRSAPEPNHNPSPPRRPSGPKRKTFPSATLEHR